MSNEAKKEARAARFGLPSAGSKVGGLVSPNIDVLKKRAERFGTVLPGSMLEKVRLFLCFTPLQQCPSFVEEEN